MLLPIGREVRHCGAAPHDHAWHPDGVRGMHETTFKPQKQPCPFHYEYREPKRNLTAKIGHVWQGGSPTFTDLHDLILSANPYSVDYLLPTPERPRPQIAEPRFATVRFDHDIVTGDAVCATYLDGLCHLFVSKVHLALVIDCRDAELVQDDVNYVSSGFPFKPPGCLPLHVAVQTHVNACGVLAGGFIVDAGQGNDRALVYPPKSTAAQDSGKAAIKHRLPAPFASLRGKVQSWVMLKDWLVRQRGIPTIESACEDVR